MASKRRKKPRSKNKSNTTPTKLNSAMSQALPHHATPELIQTTQVDHFQGPIPAPATLERYEKLLPGAADRIISMAEKEQQHRQDCEKKALDQEIANHSARNKEVARGQRFGLMIGLAAIISGTWLVSNNHPWPGGLIGTGGVIGLVAVFVFGHRKKTGAKNE